MTNILLHDNLNYRIKQIKIYLLPESNNSDYNKHGGKIKRYTQYDNEVLTVLQVKDNFFCIYFNDFCYSRSVSLWHSSFL